MINYSTYQDSPEKQYIRSNLWLPILSGRKDLLERRINYLSLPGSDLTEVRLLVENGIIEGLADLVVCEMNTLDYYKIVRDLPSLPYKKPAEIPTIFKGRIENAILTNIIDTSLPFDAVNLDFTGGAWGSSRTETSTKMRAIRKLIEKQSSHNHAFTLFLTLSTRSGGKSTVNDVLSDYQSIFAEEDWLELISKPDHVRLLTAIPIIMIHWGIECNYDTSCTHRVTYLGTGMKTRMLKFSFEFEPLTLPLYKSASEFKLSRERQRIRDVTKQDTIEISLDHENSEMIERIYQPN